MRSCGLGQAIVVALAVGVPVLGLAMNGPVTAIVLVLLPQIIFLAAAAWRVLLILVSLRLDPDPEPATELR